MYDQEWPEDDTWDWDVDDFTEYDDGYEDQEDEWGCLYPDICAVRGPHRKTECYTLRN